jgi:TPR repeat protein
VAFSQVNLYFQSHITSSKESQLNKRFFIFSFLLSTLNSPLLFANATHAMDAYLNQDYQKAFELYEQTAFLGHSKSQFNLGVQYLRGQGVKQNKLTAYAYFSLALDNGFMMAKQARKSVIKRLSESELQQAQKHAAKLIALYGQSGSKNIEIALTKNHSYNPPPKRSKNPEVEYPSSLARDGIPGFASYIFDIDRNGVPRDLVLLSSYPEKEFGESVLEKLENSRYQIIKISGSLRKFSNAQFSGVFKGGDIPAETLERINNKKKSLYAKARSGDIAAQAELASLIELMSEQPDYAVALANSEVEVNNMPEQVLLSDDAQPVFKYNSDVEGDFFNFSYLVWLDSTGKVSRYEAHKHPGIPNELKENAEITINDWHLKFSKPQKVTGIQGPYLAKFFYNNSKRNKSFSNYINRSYVSLKSIESRSKYEIASYWRKEAAKGGHEPSLFLLGVNCNMRLLKIAANNGYIPAQVQAGKCVMRMAEPTEEDINNAKYWLVSSAQSNSFIAKRLLAEFYTKHSNNQADLESAISLAEEVADETDDPRAYEYMAAASAKLGKFEDAVDYQETAVKKAWQDNYYMTPFELNLANFQSNKIASW